MATSNVSDLNRFEFLVQCHDTITITNALVLTMREFYIFFFHEEFEDCPWQKALCAGVYCGLLFVSHCSLYMSHYVPIDKCDSWMAFLVFTHDIYGNLYRVGKVKWHQVWPIITVNKIFWYLLMTQYMVGNLARTTQVEYLDRHPFDSAVGAGIVKMTAGRSRIIWAIPL